MSIDSIGFIGLGAMGFPMATNLVSAGFNIRIHTRSRTAENAKELKGSISCSSPSDVSKESELLLVCVSDDDAVENVLFGANGAFMSLKKGNIVIDLSSQVVVLVLWLVCRLWFANNFY